MRRRLVVGNWKMNPFTLQEAIELAQAVARIDRPPHVSIGVAVPAIFLERVADLAAVAVYAQDASWEDHGAYTGQVSAAMFAPYVVGTIVGHSEVRRDMGDDDARVARKAETALRHTEVIYCVGESLAQRRSAETAATLRRQIRDGIGRIERQLLEGGPPDALSIAYEPIWAIGTGVAATPAQASEAIGLIREELATLGLDADGISVLYGGSVSAANVEGFAKADGVDGALVGGASLKPEEFAAIVAAFR